ncbi:lipopolysaccharide assembly protein LapA domain-containing protein [Corynebacterium frankenforstense]|uniref:LapA family protein n=1 Tax=Corynebacterium frankenforstense TaxID=1230998 RepID=UPI003014E0CE
MTNSYPAGRGADDAHSPADPYAGATPDAFDEAPISDVPVVREEGTPAEGARRAERAERAERVEPSERSEPREERRDEPRGTGRTVAGSTWVAMIIGALLLILLLVFIMQNPEAVELKLFAWEFSVPSGVGFLLAAIVGALIMALVGGVRMFELRRAAKRG